MVGILRGASLPAANPFVFPFKLLAGASEDVAGDESGEIVSKFSMVCGPGTSELGEASGWIMVVLKDGSGFVVP